MVFILLEIIFASFFGFVFRILAAVAISVSFLGHLAVLQRCLFYVPGKLNEVQHNISKSKLNMAQNQSSSHSSGLC